MATEASIMRECRGGNQYVRKRLEMTMNTILRSLFSTPIRIETEFSRDDGKKQLCILFFSLSSRSLPQAKESVVVPELTIPKSPKLSTRERSARRTSSLSGSSNESVVQFKARPMPVSEAWVPQKAEHKPAEFAEFHLRTDEVHNILMMMLIDDSGLRTSYSMVLLFCIPFPAERRTVSTRTGEKVAR